MSSLKFILGRAGSGKSEYILSQAQKSEQLGKNAIIIVPEQYSHECEIQMLKRTGYISESLNVTSFNRLARRIIEDSGLKRKCTDSSGKAMILSRALLKSKSHLSYFKNAGEKTGYIDLFLDAISEFKKGQVMPETLFVASADAPDGLLSQKLSDIATIYEEYNKLLSDKMSDSDDNITFLASLCFGNEYIKNAHIYIDEFFRFTQNEIFCIEAFLSSGADVSISLCTDDNSELFLPAIETKKRLEDRAKKCGANISLPQIMDKNHRFLSPALSVLERAMAGEKATFGEESEDISLSVYKNRYDEVMHVATSIRKLVKDGYKYRDIAVISGDYEGYCDIVKTTFDQNEIPVFTDARRNFLDHPIVIYLFAIFDILSGITTDNVCVYIKSGFADIQRTEAAKLENYALASAINYSDWFDDERFLKKANSIFAQEEDSGDEGERQVKIKNRMLEPVVSLKETISASKNVADRVTALISFFEETHLEEKIKEKADKFSQDGMLNLADEYTEVYNIVMETLMTLRDCLGDENIGLKQLREILNAGFSKKSIGVIPKVYDSVSFGDINRSVIKNAKVLFLIGANDGIFPNVPSAGVVLSDEEREYLLSRGISVTPDSKKLIEGAELSLYINVNAAREKLFVSYPIDNDGTGMRPAGFISKLKRTFPCILQNAYLKDDFLPPEISVSSRASAYSYVLTNIKNLENNSLAKRLYDELLCDDEYKEKLKLALKFSEYENDAGRLKRNTVLSLYGNKMYGSVSKFERFSSCPFSFFIEYGLRAKERKVLKVEAPDIGSLLHEVIERFSKAVHDKNLNFKTITKKEQKEICDNIIDEMFGAMMIKKMFSLGRIEALKTRLKSLVYKSVRAICEHVARGEFEPAAFELSFDKNGDIEPVTITLPTGEEITMVGRIDRVDTLSRDGKLYIKIIDYKSGNKGYSLADIFNKTTLQLSVYMIAATENAKGSLGEGVPSFGGMFYFKLDDPILDALPDSNDDENVLKSFKMSGLLSSDEGVISAMDNTLKSGYSAVIPVYKLTNGTYSQSQSKLADNERYEKLKRYVKKAVTEIGQEIIAGNVDIKPVRDGVNSPCTYCRVRAVCGFDAQAHKCRYVKKFLTDEEIWNEME